MNITKNQYSSLIKNIEKIFIKKEIPKIHIGDNIKLKIIIQEGNKERIQNSEGTVIAIAKNNSNLNTTITIRKIIQNIGVEKIYFIHSPRILSINVINKSKVRRAKLYYLRKRSGKATRLKRKINKQKIHSSEW